MSQSISFDLANLSISPGRILKLNNNYDKKFFLGAEFDYENIPPKTVPLIPPSSVELRPGSLKGKFGFDVDFSLALGKINPKGSVNANLDLIGDSLSIDLLPSGAGVDFETPYAEAKLNLDALLSSSGAGVTFNLPVVRNQNLDLPDINLSSNNLSLLDLNSNTAISQTVSKGPLTFDWTFPNFSGLESSPAAEPSSLKDDPIWESSDTEDIIAGIGSSGQLFEAKFSAGKIPALLDGPSTVITQSLGPVSVTLTLFDILADIGADFDWQFIGGLKPLAFAKVEGIDKRVRLDKSNTQITGYSDVDGDGLISGKVVFDPIIGGAIVASFDPKEDITEIILEGDAEIDLNVLVTHIKGEKSFGPAWQDEISSSRLPAIPLASEAFAVRLSDVLPELVMTQSFSIPVQGDTLV